MVYAALPHSRSSRVRCWPTFMCYSFLIGVLLKWASLVCLYCVLFNDFHISGMYVGWFIRSMVVVHYKSRWCLCFLLFLTTAEAEKRFCESLLMITMNVICYVLFICKKNYSKFWFCQYKFTQPVMVCENEFSVVPLEINTQIKILER